MKRLIMLCLLLCPSVVLADTYLDLNLVTDHLGYKTYCYHGQCKHYNQANTSVGLTMTTKHSYDVTTGFYKNSYYKTSVYGGVNFRHEFNVGGFVVTPGVLIAGVTGYNNTPDSTSVISPMMLLNVSVGTKNTKVVFGYLPSKAFGGDIDVATLQLRVKL